MKYTKILSEPFCSKNNFCKLFDIFQTAFPILIQKTILIQIHSPPSARPAIEKLRRQKKKHALPNAQRLQPKATN